MSRGLAVPASPALRSVAGVLLLMLTGLAFMAVVQLEGTGAGQLQSYGLALVLGALLMLDIAWFSALARAYIKD